MKIQLKMPRKTIVMALLPIMLSTNLTAMLDSIYGAPSFAGFGSRIAEYLKLAPTNPPEPVYQTIKVIVTAYSSTPDQTDDDPEITAANTKTRDGIIAANFLDFHSRVQIPELYGDKVFAVEDRMNRRFTDAIPPRIDVWMPSRHLAKQFGVKSATIIVLD